MTKTKKIVINMISAVFCALALSACPNDGGYEHRTVSGTDWQPKGIPIPYTYRNYNEANNYIFETYEFYDDDENLPSWFDNTQNETYMIQTAEELKKLKEDDLYIASCFGGSYCQSGPPHIYDESYFAENSLVLWDVWDTGMGMSNWIHSLTVNKKTLMVNTLHGVSDDSRNGNTHGLFEIQVKKADIAGVAKVEIVTKYVRLIRESVHAWILEEFFDTEFTIDDFDPEKKYFSEIEDDYKHIHIYEDTNVTLKYRRIHLRLKTPGMKSEKAALEHLWALYFVDSRYSMNGIPL